MGWLVEKIVNLEYMKKGKGCEVRVGLVTPLYPPVLGFFLSSSFQHNLKVALIISSQYNNNMIRTVILIMV